MMIMQDGTPSAGRKEVRLQVVHLLVGTRQPSTKAKVAPYYRAVDQAIGVLACLGILKVMKLDPNPTSVESSKARVIDILKDTCYELLAPEGFGYGSPPDTRSYIGFDRNRNFWHDAWVILALLMARRYLWPNDANHGEEPLRLLVQEMVDRYGRILGSGDVDDKFDGTIWHWERSLKDGHAGGNVRYCGDNTLLYAMTRTLNWCPGGLSQYQARFWDFISELQEGNEDKLVSVGDIYQQVRLHPNTELAALLLCPSWN
jgi:hypothetical protein